MPKYKYSLGADPELFVRKNGQIHPICGLVGGTKSEPLSVAKNPAIMRHWGSGAAPADYKYQEDGTVYEFNVPPAYSTAHFVRSIQLSNTFAVHILAAAGLTIDNNVASHRFDAKQLTHTNANIIGCDPDFSAYQVDGKIGPQQRTKYSAEDFGTNRFAGGHLHFGYDTELAEPHVFAALVDTFVYLPILPLDDQGGRRRFYGQPGLYRPKKYGIEYRTMSNFWARPGGPVDWVSMQAFNLLHWFHDDVEALAEVFTKTPHERVRQMISRGVTTEGERTEHAELCREIRSLNLDGWDVMERMTDHVKLPAKKPAPQVASRNG